MTPPELLRWCDFGFPPEIVLAGMRGDLLMGGFALCFGLKQLSDCDLRCLEDDGFGGAGGAGEFRPLVAVLVLP